MLWIKYNDFIHRNFHQRYLYAEKIQIRWSLWPIFKVGNLNSDEFRTARSSSWDRDSDQSTGTGRLTLAGRPEPKSRIRPTPKTCIFPDLIRMPLSGLEKIGTNWRVNLDRSFFSNLTINLKHNKDARLFCLEV